MWLIADHPRCSRNPAGSLLRKLPPKLHMAVSPAMGQTSTTQSQCDVDQGTAPFFNERAALIVPWDRPALLFRYQMTALVGRLN
jgi:hypothetical protein